MYHKPKEKTKGISVPNLSSQKGVLGSAMWGHNAVNISPFCRALPPVSGHSSYPRMRLIAGTSVHIKSPSLWPVFICTLCYQCNTVFLERFEEMLKWLTLFHCHLKVYSNEYFPHETHFSKDAKDTHFPDLTVWCTLIDKNICHQSFSSISSCPLNVPFSL